LEENIKKSNYEKYMALALKKAEHAFFQGEFPVGCVIVLNNRVIADSSRTGTRAGAGKFSETDHAEIICLKKTEQSSVNYDLSKAYLFCTMEPCLMCLGAIIIAGIKKVIYAYEDPMGGAGKCDLKSLPVLYKESNIEIIPHVMRNKSLELFYGFFKKESNQYWKNSLLETYTLEQGALL